MNREAPQLSDNTKFNIISSIDPSEIKKFIVRGDKLKIKLKSGEKIKLKGFDLKVFQERSEKKVYKDTEAEKIVSLNQNNGNPLTSQELMKASEFSDLKQLLEEYRLLLQQYTQQIATLKSTIDSNPQRSLGNSITGNPYEYVQNSGNPSFGSVNNTNVNNPRTIVNSSVGPIDYGAQESNNSTLPESFQKPIDNREKTPDDAVAYNYQSIYDLDQSDLKNADKMSNRAIIRKWFKGGADNFIDIIEVGGSNKFTKPTSEEKKLLKEYFKIPLRGLSVRRNIDILDIWDDMEKAIKQNPGKLSGISNWQANKDFWINNPLLEKGNYRTGNKDVPAEYMAKLSAMYVDYKMAKVNEKPGLRSYTTKLFGMIDNARGVDGVDKFAGATLQSIVKTNQDNVGEVILSDGSALLDRTSRDGKAERMLSELVGGSEKIPNYISDDKLSRTSVMNVLNASVRTGEIDSGYPYLATTLGQYPGLSQTFNKLKGSSPDSGSMDATTMLTEGKAFGATSAEVYNIKALAEKGKLTTKYGDISDATRLMNFFVDYNNNGKGGDAADFGNFSGAQLLTNYRLAANQLRFGDGGLSQEQAETSVVTSLLQKIRSSAQHEGNTYIAHLLDSYLQKDNGGSLMDLIKQHPAIVKHIQTYISSFPGKDPHALFFADNRGSLAGYQKETQAGVTETVSATLDQQLAHIPEPDKTKFKNIILNESPRLMQDFNNQVSSLPATDRKYFDYVTLPSLQQNLAHTLMNSLKANPSISTDWALGVGVAVDLAKNVQLNLSTGYNKGTFIPGVGLGFKNNAGTLGANINATMLGAGTSVYAKIAEWDNNAKLVTSLDPLTYRTNSLTADINGGFGPRGVMLGAGLHYTSSSDRLKGIDTMATNVYETAQNFLPSVLDQKGMGIIRDLIAIDSKYGTASLAQKEIEATPLRNKFKSLVREKLSAQYGETKNTELLDVASQNILNAIIRSEYQFGSSVDVIAKYMSDQWRNGQLDALAGKYELTSLGLGIGVFLSPENLATGNIGVQLSAWISRYSRGAGAVTTSEGYNRLNLAEGFGVDNRNLKMSSGKFVDYLNGTMEVSRGMPDSNKVLPKISLSEDQRFIVVPYALWKNDNNLTLKIASSSVGRIAYDVNNNILIPRGENMRMSVTAEQDKATYVLNVGGYTTSADDISITKHKDGLSNMEMNGRKVFVTPDQIDIIEHRKKTHVVFSEASKAILESIIADGSNFSIDGSDIIYVQGGQEKRLPINGGKINSWSIGYSDAGIEFRKISVTGGVEKIATATLEYEFESFKKVMESIDSSASVIQKWEYSHRTKIEGFLEYAIANDDARALTYLKGLGDEIPAIKAIVDSDDGDAKSQLVSYLTEAFALEPNYGNKNALALMKLRDTTVNIEKFGPAYARIDGATSGGVDISSLFSRDDLQSHYESVTENPSNKREPQKDLIGYTAFYRRGANKKARGYAMTLPGYTRVLGGKLNSFESGSEKEKNALTWLIANLKTDEFAQKAIKDALATKDLGAISPESIQSLDGNQLAMLLTDPEGLKIGNDTLIIKSKPVYYLLAECANESLGIQLEAITSKDQNGEVIKRVSTDLLEEFEDGNYMTSVTNSGASRTLGKKTVFKAAIGGAFKTNFGKKQGGVVPGDGTPGTNPGETDGPSDGNPDTNPGENGNPTTPVPGNTPIETDPGHTTEPGSSGLE